MYARIQVHYGHLDFLLPVMRAAGNKDALKLNTETTSQEKRGYTAEREVDIQSKYTGEITAKITVS